MRTPSETLTRTYGKLPPPNTLREWGGLLHADFPAVERLGIDLSIRMSDGQTGPFLRRRDHRRNPRQNPRYRPSTFLNPSHPNTTAHNGTYVRYSAWRMTVHNAGYGRVPLLGRLSQAHRWMYRPGSGSNLRICGFRCNAQQGSLVTGCPSGLGPPPFEWPFHAAPLPLGSLVPTPGNSVADPNTQPGAGGSNASAAPAVATINPSGRAQLQAVILETFESFPSFGSLPDGWLSMDADAVAPTVGFWTESAQFAQTPSSPITALMCGVVACSRYGTCSFSTIASTRGAGGTMILSIAHAEVDEATNVNVFGAWSNLVVGTRPRRSDQLLSHRRGRRRPDRRHMGEF